MSKRNNLLCNFPGNEFQVMPQAGAHAIIGFYSSRLFKSKKGFIPGVVMGSILPDIDIFMVGFSFLFLDVFEPEHYFHRKATHSLFFILFIYLLFQIAGEIRSNQSIKYWGRGLALGIFLHILFDSFFFLYGIYPLWPLQLEWNMWNHYSPPHYISNGLMALEFLFFRILAWIFIQFSLEVSTLENKWFLPWLAKWRKIEFILFLLFSGLALIDFSGFNLLFGIFYLPSLAMALASIWLMQDVLEQQLSQKFEGQ